MYVHGFQSDKNSTKARFLKEKFGEKNVISETLPVNPLKAINLLQEILAEDDVSLIVGSSLGGFYAMYLSIFNSVRVVLINPSLKPHETLKQYIGKHKRFNSDEEFELTNEHLIQFKVLSEEIESLNYDQSLFNFFLSEDDEILDHSIVPNYFKNAGSIKFFKNSTHRFLNFENVLNEIEELV